jgi:hypothetical protein
MKIQLEKRDGTMFETNINTVAKTIYPKIKRHHMTEVDFINAVYDGLEHLISNTNDTE